MHLLSSVHIMWSNTRQSDSNTGWCTSNINSTYSFSTYTSFYKNAVYWIWQHWNRWLYNNWEKTIKNIKLKMYTGKWYGILPRKSKIVSHITSCAIRVSLIKPQVNPTHQHSTDDHSRFRSIHKTDEPEHECNEYRVQRYIAVGDATSRRV